MGLLIILICTFFLPFPPFLCFRTRVTGQGIVDGIPRDKEVDSPLDFTVEPGLESIIEGGKGRSQLKKWASGQPRVHALPLISDVSILRKARFSICLSALSGVALAASCI